MHKLRCGDEMVNSVRKANHPGARFSFWPMRNDGDGVAQDSKNISPIYSKAAGLAKVMPQLEVGYLNLIGEECRKTLPGSL